MRKRNRRVRNEERTDRQGCKPLDEGNRIQRRTSFISTFTGSQPKQRCVVTGDVRTKGVKVLRGLFLFFIDIRFLGDKNLYNLLRSESLSLKRKKDHKKIKERYSLIYSLISYIFTIFSQGSLAFKLLTPSTTLISSDKTFAFILLQIFFVSLRGILTFRHRENRLAGKYTQRTGRHGNLSRSVTASNPKDLSECRRRLSMRGWFPGRRKKK